MSKPQSSPKSSPGTSQTPLWADMRAQDFDSSEPLTLFGLEETDNSARERQPDKCGTPDLFSSEADGE